MTSRRSRRNSGDEVLIFIPSSAGTEQDLLRMAGDDAGQGLFKLEGEFAAATPKLMARAPEFQARLEAALNFTKPQFNESMRAGHANM